MTAKEKIEKLTDGWYGYTLFAGLITLIHNGIGFFSIFLAIGSTIFSLFITFLVGRWLLARSSIGRWIVITLSAFGVILAGLATAAYAFDIFRSFGLSPILSVLLFGSCTLMNLRSVRTLSESSVKAYFR